MYVDIRACELGALGCVGSWLAGSALKDAILSLSTWSVAVKGNSRVSDQLPYL